MSSKAFELLAKPDGLDRWERAWAASSALLASEAHAEHGRRGRPRAPAQ